jgi:hypothetical protein
LVSVLQNRPAASEVLIVLNQAYDDPYRLADEVRFVQAPAGAGRVECLNVGLRHSRGDVVHVLAPGAEVSEGWTDEPLRRLDDPSVASVVPLVLDPRDRLTVADTGVGYRAGGVPVRPAITRFVSTGTDARLDVLGPCFTAGFYRRTALESLSRPFDPIVGERLADVDLALSLRAIGWRAVFEPQSVVYALPPADRLARGFQAAREAERLFLRHAAQTGWASSLFGHAVAVVAEFARTLPRPSAVAQLTGRLAGWAEWPAHRQYRAALASLRSETAPYLSGRHVGTRIDRIQRTVEPKPMARSRPAVVQAD